ncbi:multiple sugar transport system permease protein [Frigoribacterium sp. PhB160]|uniref:carbohydrate ABC transporter permease n=1 Tax=Frigoribacterium sp. PhB160 TaxID=2485192 RepID=UPI000F4A3B62|nr:sugar ABC transporter permease [Frigoribacterium sp. PhB160]ROS58231.1 multiple sugar transport system permease protein [Frigoribacterium sp. PhB160]
MSSTTSARATGAASSPSDGPGGATRVTHAGSAPKLPARRQGARHLTPVAAPWLFLAPAIALFVTFLLIPIGYAAYLSVTSLKVTGGGAFGTRESVFVGLENYSSALTDPELGAALGRLAVFGLISVPFTLLTALAFALLLDVPGVRASRFSRTVIFLPYAVPGVIATLLWGFLYLPSTSPVSFVTRALGLGDVQFLTGDNLFGSLANISIWGGVGFNMIVMYTALRSIPADIYEAAAIDGATQWQIAWRIKIPLMTPALVLTTLFSLIGALQAYGEPQTLKSLTSGISTTFFPLMKVYQDAFGNDDVSSAAATSVVLAVGTLVISLVLLRLLQRRAFGDEER